MALRLSTRSTLSSAAAPGALSTSTSAARSQANTWRGAYVRSSMRGCEGRRGAGRAPRPTPPRRPRWSASRRCPGATRWRARPRLWEGQRPKRTPLNAHADSGWTPPAQTAIREARARAAGPWRAPAGGASFRTGCPLSARSDSVRARRDQRGCVPVAAALVLLALGRRVLDKQRGCTLPVQSQRVVVLAARRSSSWKPGGATPGGSRAWRPARGCGRGASAVAFSGSVLRRAGAEAAAAPRSADEDRVFEDALAEFDGQGDARWTKARLHSKSESHCNWRPQRRAAQGSALREPASARASALAASRLLSDAR